MLLPSKNKAPDNNHNLATQEEVLGVLFFNMTEDTILMMP
jgi:hypothetical protein